MAWLLAWDCPRARPLPRLQTVVSPRMLVLILMRAWPQDEIRRRIEDKRSEQIPLMLVRHPPHACAGVFDKAQGPRPGLLLSA